MAEDAEQTESGGHAGADAAGCVDSEHVLSRDCSVECLAWVLSRMALNPLRSYFRGLSSPGTVGNVTDMYRQDRLRDIYQLGPRRISEIGIALRYAGLAGPGEG